MRTGWKQTGDKMKGIMIPYMVSGRG